ncbi:MAG: hypothetical protein HYZ45_05220 [Burkholderiales bacterium]|nr:hypothetical protein [Burkholderiales bacterium]
MGAGAREQGQRLIDLPRYARTMQRNMTLYTHPAMILETAVDRYFLQKILDFIEENGEKKFTHKVRALQAKLLVSQLASFVATS